MIIFILIVSVLVFAIAVIGMKQRLARVFWIVLSLALAIVSCLLFTVNDQVHWGMKETMTTTDKPLTAAAKISGTDTILYKALGDGTEKVVIYKTNAKQKKVATTTADVTTKNQFQKSAKIKYPTLETRTYRYTFKNAFYRVLFAGTGSNHQFKKRTNIFKLPQDWVILSTSQVAKLQKTAKASEAKAKTQLKQAIAAQLKQAMAQNPNMTAAQQKALTKEVQAKATKQMTAQVQKQLQQLSLK